MARRKGKLRLKLKPEEEGSALKEATSESRSTSTTPASTPQRTRSRASPKTATPLQFKILQEEVEAMIGSNKITYKGWEEDWKEFLALSAKYNDENNISTSLTIADWVLRSRLQGMIHKQQAFLGDRSHPYLKQLDALLPHLKYNGWPQDFKAALQAHYQHDNDWDREKALFRMKQRQCVLYNKDRSHPRVVELDYIAARLTYPGHERDAQNCLQLHFQHADDYIGNNVMAKQFQSLLNRQAHWDGKPVQQLESLQSILSYEGCKEDLEATREAHLHACSTLSNGQVMEYTTALHHIQHKNALANGDRSHPRIVALDRVVQRAPPSLQNSPTWQQLVRECEQTHLRYATDDWIGNAIWDELLKQLRLWKEQKTSNIPSTPLHKKPLKAVSPSSTVATAETAITASYSWSSAEEEEEESGDVENNDEVEGSTLASF